VNKAEDCRCHTSYLGLKEFWFAWNFSFIFLAIKRLAVDPKHLSENKKEENFYIQKYKSLS